MTRRPAALAAGVLLALLLSVAQARAQVPPLPRFIARVAALWAAQDAEGIVALATPGDDIMLDVGQGQQGTASARQAAVALRALFDARATTALQVGRVTVADGAPLSGFGELRWETRAEGIASARRATVFIAAAWDGRAWRIRQIRVLGLGGAG